MRRRKLFLRGWDLPVILTAALLYLVPITVTLLTVFVGEGFALYRPLAAAAVLLFPLGVAILGLFGRRAEKLWRRWLLGGLVTDMCFLALFLWLLLRPRA